MPGSDTEQNKFNWHRHCRKNYSAIFANLWKNTTAS